jgi:hypothetical protein
LDPEEIKDIDILDISSIISWKLTKKLDIEKHRYWIIYRKSFFKNHDPNLKNRE